MVEANRLLREELRRRVAEVAALREKLDAVRRIVGGARDGVVDVDSVVQSMTDEEVGGVDMGGGYDVAGVLPRPVAGVRRRAVPRLLVLLVEDHLREDRRRWADRRSASY